MIIPFNNEEKIMRAGSQELCRLLVPARFVFQDLSPGFDTSAAR